MNRSRMQHAAAAPRPGVLARVVAAVAAVAVAGVVGFGLEESSARADVNTVTIWGDEKPEGASVDSESRSAELGTRFTASTDGVAIGVRFYKTPENGGTHVGNLWDASGKRLATATFENETARGWQTVYFDEPVTIAADERYVASYLAPEGRYYQTHPFWSGSSSDVLSVHRGSSGVYAYGKSSSFPTKTWNRSQYWVDVVFAPSSGAAPSPTATPSPSPTVAPSPSPTATPSPSPTATPSPAPTQPASPSVSSSFPTAANTGLPAGWTPKRVVTGDLWISTPGAVVEDLRITNGVLYVDAPNVTIRRAELVGSRIVNDPRSGCNNGLLIEDTTVVPRGDDGGMSAIGTGGYTARNVKIDGVTEGFRVGGNSIGCGPVVIENSWVRVVPPKVCGDWHGDALQGYDGPALTVRNTYLELAETGECGGTAAFFYPHSQGNTSVTIDGLVVSGGGYVFRLGMPGTVTGLRVVDNSWGYGPMNVKCSVVSSWSAQVVRPNADGSTTPLRNLGCTTEDGN